MDNWTKIDVGLIVKSLLKKIWAPVKRQRENPKKLIKWLFLLGFITSIMLFASIDKADDVAAFLFLVILFIFLVVFIILSHDYKNMRKLSERIDNFYNGDFSKVEPPKHGILKNDFEKLNQVSETINATVKNQVMAERMKINLITNVSHDLKTPLTSIISYIDLLSKEENLSDEARDYVNILTTKSERLRQMIYDLFDMAKVTSGQDLKPERIDGVTLLNQVIGDMDDKIKQSGKIIRQSINSDEYKIFADGTKLYRVFQNVIENALKYSLDGTRIYVKLEADENNMTVTVTNTASYEMDFTAEEISERFARGDKARTTEGNGLGISIAKSYTEACGGTFTLSLDGDQFKVKITLPHIKETL